MFLIFLNNLIIIAEMQYWKELLILPRIQDEFFLVFDHQTDDLTTNIKINSHKGIH